MKKAFTLVELMIVVVVIGILAGFGAANFTKSINKARVRDAISNLSIIHAANMMYRARNGSNCTTDPEKGNACAGILGINSMNGADSLNIMAGSSSYQCSGTSCTATKSGDFTVTLDLDRAIYQGESENNPSCDSDKGFCP